MSSAWSGILPVIVLQCVVMLWWYCQSCDVFTHVLHGCSYDCPMTVTYLWRICVNWSSNKTWHDTTNLEHSSCNVQLCVSCRNNFWYELSLLLNTQYFMSTNGFHKFIRHSLLQKKIHISTGPVIWFQWACDIHIKTASLRQDVTTDWRRAIYIYDGVFSGAVNGWITDVWMTWGYE